MNITENDLKNKLLRETCFILSKKSKRYGYKISLRSIIYNCIREIYFELNDFPAYIDFKNLDENDLNIYLSILGRLGDAGHKYYQKKLDLVDKPYTEKLMYFKYFKPLEIASKCDGIDIENNTLYEIKTKGDIDKLKEPIKNEFLQGILSCFLYEIEQSVKINHLRMMYVSRNNGTFKFFDYSLKNKEDENYYNPIPDLEYLNDKIQTLIQYNSKQTIPPMDNKYIILESYGHDRCKICPYNKICFENR